MPARHVIDKKGNSGLSWTGHRWSQYHVSGNGGPPGRAIENKEEDRVVSAIEVMCT